MPLCQFHIVGSVLVVGPRGDLRNDVCRHIVSERYHVHTVETDEGALQCLRHPEFHFDAIVVLVPGDCHEPGTFARKYIRGAPTVSVILIGGHGSCESKALLCEGRIIGWLHAPLRRELLLNFIRVAIDQSSRARQRKKGAA